jgi:hypothetical protein
LAKYLLDTNCFITAFRIFYHPEIAPGFWSKLWNGFQNGDFYIIKEVYDEIKQKEDCLKAMLQQYIPAEKILTSKQDVNVMQNWARIDKHLRQNYKREIDKFMKTDAYLVAYALSYKDVVIVTLEKWRETRRKPYIPKVCEELGLKVSPSLRKSYDFKISLANKSLLFSYKCITLFEAMYLTKVKL